MRLSELLSEDTIVAAFSAKDKWEAIQKLLDIAIKKVNLGAKEHKAILDALIARENVASTGMEHGIALPHTKVDAVENPLCVLAISKDGIPFQSQDGKPANIIVLLVIPNKAIKQHVKTLAGIARLLGYEEVRQSLISAPDAKEVLNLVKEEEKKIFTPGS